MLCATVCNLSIHFALLSMLSLPVLKNKYFQPNIVLCLGSRTKEGVVHGVTTGKIIISQFQLLPYFCLTNHLSVKNLGVFLGQHSNI